MIRVRVLGSGSTGNCYVLEDVDADSKLMLECGLGYKDITRKLNFDFKGIVGCLCTHHHGDHYQLKTARQLNLLGIGIYGSKDLQKHFCQTKVLQEKQVASIGDMDMSLVGGEQPRWKVKPLRVPHGDCVCYSYVITAPSGETLLFATDLSDFPYLVKGVNYMMIEANYAEDVLLDALMHDEDIRSQSDNHMEIGKTCEIVVRHLSSDLRGILLVHLSRKLGRPMEFRKRVVRVCGAHAMGIDIDYVKNDSVYVLSAYPWQK